MMMKGVGLNIVEVPFTYFYYRSFLYFFDTKVIGVGFCLVVCLSAQNLYIMFNT